jgi:hypothetical protein
VPEAVRVSVSEIRREIYRASGYAAGEGQPTTEFLGTLFHRVFQAVMDPASDLAWTNVLDAESLNDAGKLQEHVYASVVGPRLRQNQAALQTSAAQVLAMWEATGHLCRYICQLLTNSVAQHKLRYDAARREWIGLEQFSVEEELTWLVQESGWPAPVLVSGVVDGVWRSSPQRWCAIELKLGAGSSDADLAQLCLYHEMLRSGESAGPGQIALLHFQPELKRTEFSEEALKPAQQRLRALIGRIAGMLADERAQDPDDDAPKPAHRELGARLVKVLAQFGPMVALESDPVVGPSFLRFHIMPEPGVKVKEILPLGSDLAVQLRLSRPALIKLEGGALVIDLQRPDRQTLLFSEFRDSLAASEHGSAKLLVGIDLKRQPRFLDLRNECPHVLIAGTTQSGKSEWLRMALASLIAANRPETLRLMVIDPKRVTFDELRHSPFLLNGHAMLYTPDEALHGFERLIELMEERYILMAKHGCTDLAALQARGEILPRVVVFCDEYGNLVASRKMRESIESAIVQLGAKARAAGIHLVLATQDPRAQILTPALKSNLDGRVCLRTTSSVQSRMMLEENGAEALLGHGDLLFKTVGEPVRLQAPLLEDADRQALFGPRANRA